MNKAEKFYRDGILNEKKFNLISHFKRKVAEADSLCNSKEAAEYYANQVAEVFELDGMKDDFTKMFYSFHENEWSKGKYQRYHVEHFKEKLGMTKYRKLSKAFKNSKIKGMLEAGEIKRVGFVTFVNMICYIIYHQNYSK